MPTKRVGIDVDDVLADFVSSFRKICNEIYGTPLDLQPVDWSWSNFGLTEAQIDHVWKRVRATPNFWYKLDLAPDATASGFIKLVNADAKLFFITKRFDTTGHIAEDQTAAWLEDHFNIPYPVVLANTPKGLTAKALGLTHFIDDRDVNCLDVLKHVPNCQVFLKDTSHNQHFHHPDIRRVSSFDEFARIVGGQN